LYFQNWSGRDLRSLKDVFTVLLAILTFAAELWENIFFAAELWKNKKNCNVLKLIAIFKHNKKSADLFQSVVIFFREGARQSIGQSVFGHDSDGSRWLFFTSFALLTCFVVVALLCRFGP
jgi:hypothetical protein